METITSHIEALFNYSKIVVCQFTFAQLDFYSRLLARANNSGITSRVCSNAWHMPVIICSIGFLARLNNSDLTDQILDTCHLTFAKLDLGQSPPVLHVNKSKITWKHNLSWINYGTKCETCSWYMQYAKCGKYSYSAHFTKVVHTMTRALFIGHSDCLLYSGTKCEMNRCLLKLRIGRHLRCNI